MACTIVNELRDWWLCNRGEVRELAMLIGCDRKRLYDWKSVPPQYWQHIESATGGIFNRKRIKEGLQMNSKGQINLEASAQITIDRHGAVTLSSEDADIRLTAELAVVLYHFLFHTQGLYVEHEVEEVPE